jgi:hypothetical protein
MNTITDNEDIESQYGWWVLRYINPHNEYYKMTDRETLDQHPLFLCNICDNVYNTRRIARMREGIKNWIYIQTNYSTIPKKDKKIKTCRKCAIPSTIVESY